MSRENVLGVMMTVELRVKEVALERGIQNPYQLMKLLGTFDPAMASRLWKGGMDKIGLKTIDRLCEIFSCEPGDLFKRVKEKPVRRSTKNKKA